MKRLLLTVFLVGVVVLSVPTWANAQTKEEQRVAAIQFQIENILRRIAELRVKLAELRAAEEVPAPVVFWGNKLIARQPLRGPVVLPSNIENNLVKKEWLLKRNFYINNDLVATTSNPDEVLVFDTRKFENGAYFLRATSVYINNKYASDSIRVEIKNN